MAKRGAKPNHYVTSDGETILGLRRDAKSGRFFPVGKGSPSFGTDEVKAIHRFRVWQAQQNVKPKPRIPVTIQAEARSLGYVGEPYPTVEADHLEPLQQAPDEVPCDIFTDLEAIRSAVRREIRESIYRNPRQAAAALDCEPLALLANVQTLKPPPPSQKLDTILESYLEESTISPREATNSRTWWNEFKSITKARTVVDLSRDSFQDYRRTIKQRQGKRSNIWTRSRFGKIKTIVRNALSEIDLTDEEKSILGNIALLKPPPKPRPKPVDIDPEELEAILGKADEWQSALILLALNAAYYPIDCQRLEWSMIEFARGTIRFDRTKSVALAREPLPRICSLWKRTIKALKKIKNGHTHVFLSTQGQPAHIDTINDHFVDCRDKADVQRPLTFQHLRKSALTAASNDPSVPDRQIDLLAGHSSGIKEHYVVKKNVQLACEAIERHYFGGSCNR